MKQAHAIGLAGKDNWNKYPRAMLRSRCVSEGIRTVYPGCVVGTYTDEEVESFSPSPAPAIAIAVDEEEEEDGHQLLMPNGKKHAIHAQMNDWVEGYNALVERIQSSGKLSEESKKATVQELFAANRPIFELMTGDQISQVKQ